MLEQNNKWKVYHSIQVKYMEVVNGQAKPSFEVVEDQLLTRILISLQHTRHHLSSFGMAFEESQFLMTQARN